MATAIFEVEQLIFEPKALAWSQQFDQVCFLQSNGYADEFSAIASILAIGSKATFRSDGTQTFEKLNAFKTKHPESWMFGFFGYDLKNEIEELETSFSDRIGFEDTYFFVPQVVLRLSEYKVEISADDPYRIFERIQESSLEERSPSFQGRIQKRMSKADYMSAFEKMLSHIKRGDIYEVNLCQEFYAENVHIDPLPTYLRLGKISPTPFSTFFRIEDKYILSASPERFLAKRGQTLISQPIKGTAPRGRTPEEDEAIKYQLRYSPKEIAENVMIVDLVRNDMTRSAMPGTVAAERRLEIKTYKQVHQLVSTITCTIDHNISDIEAIKNVFPPGSMTGAPKISAMQLCDQYENSRRSVYAGTIGYFAPNGDFDFNVVIRTILYNSTAGYLSFHTGGALTFQSDGEKEYEECLLKASAILHTLETSLVD